MSSFATFIYTLCLLLPGPAVGVRVIQSPAALTLLRGQTATFTCSMLPGEGEEVSMRIFWFRTKDNPELWDNKTESFLKTGDRLSVSMGSLVIREVTVHDADTYHCLVLIGEAFPWKKFIGNGTTLHIQAKPDISLTLDPGVEGAETRSLTCVAAGFFPRELNMSWAVVGQLSYETEAGPLRENGDGSFNVSSRLRLTDPRLEAGTVATCLVQHLTGTGSVSERFSPTPRKNSPATARDATPVPIPPPSIPSRDPGSPFRLGRGSLASPPTSSTVPVVRGFLKYYFILLSLILIVPICVWIVYNYHSKLKKENDSSVHDTTVDIQRMRKRKNSVNEDNVSINKENLHYAPVYFNKGQQRQELRWTEQSQETEYAILKVKDKSNL